MKAYIRSVANISPQKTFDTDSFLNELVEYKGDRLTCIEPDYKQIIDPKLIRRMGRVIKMGVAAALACLKEAGLSDPGAIITGTAYGCLEDSGVFLTNLVEQDEEPLSPTAFVHSTHNTIGAQVALLLKCKNYNNTFVNGGASFEHSLIDALLYMTEEGVDNVLVGGIDEITDISHAILTRFGLYKRDLLSNLHLFEPGTKGTIAGEGAAFFLLANNHSVNDLATLEAVHTFYKPTANPEIEKEISTFLTAQSININKVDLVILGNDGDPKNDRPYNRLKKSILGGVPSINYKHLCGEYPTSTAFALWLAVSIIRSGRIPEILDAKSPVAPKINRILIYNHYQNIHHSLILLSSC